MALSSLSTKISPKREPTHHLNHFPLLHRKKEPVCHLNLHLPSAETSSKKKNLSTTWTASLYRQKSFGTNTTLPTTVSVSTSTNTKPNTDEMDINNKIVLYRYYFMKGFIRAVVQEENEEAKTLILNKKLSVNSLFFLVGDNCFFFFLVLSSKNQC